MIKVKFIKLVKDAIPFKYTRNADACMDMYSLITIRLQPGTTEIIPTGIAIEIPEGYYGQVKGRSGNSSNGLLVHTGTIESEYRGDVGIICTNVGTSFYQINKGDRIAQFSIHPVYEILLTEVDKLSITSRGINGYGSSGK